MQEALHFETSDELIGTVGSTGGVEESAEVVQQHLGASLDHQDEAVARRVEDSRVLVVLPEV